METKTEYHHMILIDRNIRVLKLITPCVPATKERGMIHGLLGHGYSCRADLERR